MMVGVNTIWRQLVAVMTLTMFVICDGNDGVSTNVYMGNFKMYNNVAKPNDLSSCVLKLTRPSKLKCVDMCLEDVWCVGAYMEIVNSSSTDGDWKCYLCENVWDVTSLATGLGHYVVPQYPPIAEPSISGAVFETRSAINGVMAATFSSPLRPGHYLHLAFDDRARSWPEISQSCQDNIHLVESVWDILVDVRTGGGNGVYEFHPICGEGETNRGYAVCQGNGVWTQWDPIVLKMCIPSQCVTYNSYGRPAYEGSISRTPSGRTCQRWDSTHPHHHFYNVKPRSDYFRFDNQNPTQAENFCRSANELYLWCYTTDLWSRWEYCEITQCQPLFIP